MKIMNVAAVLLAIPALILGSHGLYAYFYPLESMAALFTQSQSELFFAIEVPAGIDDIVEWMSLKGLQSWFIPAIVSLLGIAFISYAFKNK